MNNLTRYGLIDDVFNDFARGFFLKPMMMENQPDLQIRIDGCRDIRIELVLRRFELFETGCIHGNRVHARRQVRIARCRHVHSVW